MAASTGPVLAMGAITLGNEVVLNAKPFNWRIPLATVIAAGGFALLERLNGPLAVGMAWLALVAVLVTRVNPAVPSPAESLLKATGGL